MRTKKVYNRENIIYLSNNMQKVDLVLKNILDEYKIDLSEIDYVKYEKTNKEEIKYSDIGIIISRKEIKNTTQYWGYYVYRLGNSEKIATDQVTLNREDCLRTSFRIMMKVASRKKKKVGKFHFISKG